MTAVRHCGRSDKVARLPGQLVAPAGPRALARVTQDSWSNPRALGHERDSPGSAGQPRGPSDPGSSALDSRTTPRALGPGPWSPGTAGRTSLVRTWPRDAQECLSTKRALGHGAESPGTAVRHPGPRARSESPGRAGRLNGPLFLGPSPLGQLINTAGLRTRGQVAWDSWPTSWALGPGSKWSGTACQT